MEPINPGSKIEKNLFRVAPVAIWIYLLPCGVKWVNVTSSYSRVTSINLIKTVVRNQVYKYLSILFKKSKSFASCWCLRHPATSQTYCLGDSYRIQNEHAIFAFCLWKHYGIYGYDIGWIMCGAQYGRPYATGDDDAATADRRGRLSKIHDFQPCPRRLDESTSRECGRDPFARLNLWFIVAEWRVVTYVGSVAG